MIEAIEENKKILRAEYQRGFANGGKDMNEKWLITRQELISEFVKSINLFTTENYSLYWLNEKKKWEEKLK